MTQTRRVPFFLVIDTSGSMSGAPIAAVEQGLRNMKKTVATEGETQQYAWISMISFNDRASVIQEPIPVTKFHAPKFNPDTIMGRTSFKAAIETLEACYNSWIVKRETNNQASADFKPILILFTDGMSTDSASEWNPVFETWNRDYRDRFSARIACHATHPEDVNETPRAMEFLRALVAEGRNGDSNGRVIDIGCDYKSIVGLFRCVSQTLVQSVKNSQSTNDFGKEVVKNFDDNINNQAELQEAQDDTW